MPESMACLDQNVLTVNTHKEVNMDLAFLKAFLCSAPQDHREFFFNKPYSGASCVERFGKTFP